MRYQRRDRLPELLPRQRDGRQQEPRRKVQRQRRPDLLPEPGRRALLEGSAANSSARARTTTHTSKNPVLFFAWDRNFVAYGVNYGRGTYGYYGVRGNDVTGPYGDFYKAYSNRFAFYLQDSWTIGQG